jgi:DNA-binding XRE family transcriptional regulator
MPIGKMRSNGGRGPFPNRSAGRPLIEFLPEFLPDEVAMDMQPAELQAWRATLGLSQSQLAALLGVRTMTVSRWETGTRTIPTFLHLALEALRARQQDSRLRAESFDGV